MRKSFRVVNLFGFRNPVRMLEGKSSAVGGADGPLLLDLHWAVADACG